jgi:hypothetical protein
LHCLGNLLFSTEKQQISLGNNPFNVKLGIYTKNDLGLKLQEEMPRFLKSAPEINMGIPEIEKRRDHIIKFIKKEWSFEAMDKIFGDK